MIEKKESKQTVLSKKWLVEALIELMMNKEYSKITITELTSKADLSRRTFYRHFNSIDQVLNYQLTLVGAEYVSFYFKERDKDLHSLIITFFRHWQNHKDFLIALNNNNMLDLLLNKFMPNVRKQIALQLHKDKTSVEQDYYFAFITGGLWNLLVQWVDDGATLSLEEISNIAIFIVNHPRFEK